MVRKKGTETWRRIMNNVEKIPDLVVDGAGWLYEIGKRAPVDKAELIRILAAVKKDLHALSAELQSKGGHAGKKTPKTRKKKGGKDAGRQVTYSKDPTLDGSEGHTEGSPGAGSLSSGDGKVDRGEPAAGSQAH